MIKADMKRQVYDTTKFLFCRDGYSKTTMRAIAMNADTSVGLPIYYFKSKENLGVQIYSEFRQKLYSVCSRYYPSPEFNEECHHLATVSDIMLLLSHDSLRDMYTNISNSPEMAGLMREILADRGRHDLNSPTEYLNSLTVSAVKARLINADAAAWKLTREELGAFMFHRYMRLQEPDTPEKNENFKRFYSEYLSLNFRLGDSFELLWDDEVLKARMKTLESGT